MRRLILSGLGSGWLKPAPGTWGSLAAIPAAWALHWAGGPILLALAAAALYLAGLRLVAEETRAGGDHDPSWIVADEWVGQWVALLPVSAGAWIAGVGFWALWPGILAAFAAFRLFDISKPWIIGRADARGDARGVMEDDLWAGIFAALVVAILAGIAHAGILASAPVQP